MANETMTLIETKTIGVGGSSTIDFTNIPQTGTDLVVYLSTRASNAATTGICFMSFNDGATGFDYKVLAAQEGTVSSFDAYAVGVYSGYVGNTPATNATTNTFGSTKIYIPSYATTGAKSYSVETVTENNGAASQYIVSGKWGGTAAVTSLSFSIYGGESFVQGSTATLYSVKKATELTAKATGGTITYGADGYVYHTFTSSGTFTPTTSLSAEVITVAGGASGGYTTNFYLSGGGGAGGLLYNSLSVSTAQTVTVGAGGASKTVAGTGNNGSNSSFGASITAYGGGGGGGGGDSAAVNGNNGGSGGGAKRNASGGTATIGTGYTTGYGNNGGVGLSGGGGGGGGGAGSAGGNASGSSFFSGGNGGNGTNIYASFASAANVGVSGYLAGGGGGFGDNGGGSGGLGGGTSGGDTANAPANSGSGTGGTRNASTGAGGSGVVIVRYLG